MAAMQKQLTMEAMMTTLAVTLTLTTTSTITGGPSVDTYRHVDDDGEIYLISC